MLQQILAHLRIKGNKHADILTKAAWDLDQFLTVTSKAANAVAKGRIFDQTFKKLSMPDLNCSRNLSSVIERIPTGHFRGMKIFPDDNSRSYAFYRNCPDTKLAPDYIFDNQVIIASLFLLSEPPQDILYSLRAPNVAALIFNSLGSIQISLTYGHDNSNNNGRNFLFVYFDPF